MTKGILLVGDSNSNPDILFKTDFVAPDPFVYIESDGRRLLVPARMEQPRAQKESSVPEVRSFEDFGYRELVREQGDRASAFSTLLTRIVEEIKVDGVVVQASFPVYYADSLRAAGVSVEIDPQLFVMQRRQKSAVQIEAMQQAQKATERATARAIQVLRESSTGDGMLVFDSEPLTSERLRAEVEVSLIRDGMEPSGPIVAGGPRASDPHWEGEGPLRPDEAIILDIFPRSKKSKYWADMTRTVVKGKPSAQLQAMYEAVLRAQEAAFERIRAGVNGNDVHEAVKAVFREAGFDREEGPKYTHGTGHGVGLEIHENPGLSIQDVELLEGDAVSVEPGLYDPEIGGVRIEDLVVVTKDGFRNLTAFPKHLLVSDFG